MAFTALSLREGTRVMPSGELHALLKDLAFIVMLSKSFRKSVQLAEASILISNAEPHLLPVLEASILISNAKPHLLPVLEASILISNAESHVKDFSHGYYQALLPLSYSITSCLYKEAKRPLTFVYTLSVNSIVKLAYSSCLKPSSLLCFPKLSTQSNYLLPCPAKPLQASNCFQTRPRPYTFTDHQTCTGFNKNNLFHLKLQNATKSHPSSCWIQRPCRP